MKKKKKTINNALFNCRVAKLITYWLKEQQNKANRITR